MKNVFGLLSNVIRMILFLIIMIFLSGALSAGFVLLYGWIYDFGLWWGLLLLLVGGISLAFGLYTFIANLAIGMSLLLSPYRWYSYFVVYSIVAIQNVYSIHFAWTVKDDYDWFEILLAIIASLVILWINNIFIVCLRSYYSVREYYDY